MDGLAVSSKTPEDMVFLPVAVSDPPAVAVRVFFGNRLFIGTAAPVASNHQLAPHRQEQDIEAVRLRLVQNPVQVFKITLVWRIRIVI